MGVRPGSDGEGDGGGVGISRQRRVNWSERDSREGLGGEVEEFRGGGGGGEDEGAEEDEGGEVGGVRDMAGGG